MKKIFILFFIFFISTTENVLSKVNKIVVKVENEIITNYEIKNKIISSLIVSGQEINQVNIDSLKRSALENLIQLKLKKIELAKFDIKSDKNQINNYLIKVSSNDLVQFKKVFINYNLDFNLFLEEIETEFKWQKLIYMFYANKIEVNEIAVQQELQEIVEKKLLLEEFKLSEIEFTVNKEKKNEIIKNIQNQIKNYGFKVAANKFSISPSSKNNGEIGWVNSKSLDPKIYEIISRMEVGDISIPFERQNSFMILRLDDKKKTQYQNIDPKKVKENLINQKKNELFNLYSRSHLSKIKNSSLIEYR